MEDILLTHSGKQHSYKVARSLQKLGRLARFITSFYYNPQRLPDKFFSHFKKIDRVLKKRYEDGLSSKVIRFPIFEIPELLLRSLFGNCRIFSDTVCMRDVLFDKFIARTQLHGCKIFWGFQGSCSETIKVARKKGIKTIVEFSTAHITAATKMLGEEKVKNPEWADSITNLYFPAWYLRRLKEEPFITDYCIVASEFSKRTLEDAGVESAKIIVLPLGVDLAKFEFKKRKTNSAFQILFIGGVGQRKGIKYLLDAIKKLNTNELRLNIIGPVIGNGATLKNYSNFYEYFGVLDRAEVIKHMHQSDCLVLPSIFEGFGLVILEAMATGMPVIASTHSAAPELIRKNIDGFVLEPHDVNSLAEKIDWMICHREGAVEMGINASKRAEEFSWERHKDRLKTVLKYIEDGK